MDQRNQNQQQNQSNNRVQNTNYVQNNGQLGQQPTVQIQQQNQLQQNVQVQNNQNQQQIQQGQNTQQVQQMEQIQQSVQKQQVQKQVQQQNPRGARQISQEELQQELFGRQLSQEELQKTQVLNLKDVEEVAKMERFTSMKPGVIVAVLGVLLLTFGTTFQVVNSMRSTSKDEPDNVVEKRTVDNDSDSLLKRVYLNCTKTSMNNSDGTNTVYSIEYQFSDNKLVEFTKTFEMTEIDGNLTGTQTIQNYMMAYQAFLNNTTGYVITLVPKAKGLIVTTKVDLTKLDQTTLNPTQQTHFSTSVDYPKDTVKDTIEIDMNSQGLVCE